MNLLDLDWAASTIVNYVTPLLEHYAATTRQVKRGYTHPNVGHEARAAMNSLAEAVLKQEPPIETGGRLDAWHILGGDKYLGPIASTFVHDTLIGFGASLDQAEQWLQVKHAEISAFIAHTKGIAERAAYVVDQHGGAPVGPRLAFYLPGALDLVRLSKEADDLDTALRGLATVAGRPPQSPGVVSVDNGSLSLQILLDKETWLFAGLVLKAIYYGLGSLTKMRTLIAEMKSAKLPTDDAEKRLQGDTKELATTAIKQAIQESGVAPDPESVTKAERSASYFIEGTSNGASFRLLATGNDETALGVQVNRALEQLLQPIENVLHLEEGSKRLPSTTDTSSVAEKREGEP